MFPENLSKSKIVIISFFAWGASDGKCTPPGPKQVTSWNMAVLHDGVRRWEAASVVDPKVDPCVAGKQTWFPDTKNAT